MPVLQFICAGGAGGMASRTLTAPIERVRWAA